MQWLFQLITIACHHLQSKLIKKTQCPSRKTWGKDLNQLKQLNSIIKKSNKKNIIQVGYNHRYHPAIIKTLDLLKNKKKLVKLCISDVEYGHGGRLNYEKEWRANKKIWWRRINWSRIPYYWFEQITIR